MKIKPALFALLIGGFAFILLISFVYAFVQQAEAKRQAELAIANERRAITCEQRVQEMNQQLVKQTQELQQAVELATQKIRLLEEQAAKSKSKK
ncbi:MAG: hypothetical protein J0L67_14525 [Cytophagales bacterium]|nr:hypothetical protein [Cytophagales bacterium]